MKLARILILGAGRDQDANDHRFAFGTLKIEIVGGYTSAMLLLGVAGLMAFQSIERLFRPSVIHFEQAIAIAFSPSPPVCTARLRAGPACVSTWVASRWPSSTGRNSRR
ncbi:MAG: cation transporter [Xanthomonadales bacterium]|nr:cation transporter [Xanthomonadales bacterium]MBK7209603.1 cation transporter [Xanthomonadales bacterium]